MELQNSTLDDIAAVIGFSAALRLSAWFGDCGNLYVPANAEDGQLLVKLIGLSAAARLSAEWGQQHVAVPRLRAYEDDLRKRRIGRCLEKGFGYREIAGMERISQRRVQQIAEELTRLGLLLEKPPGKSPLEKASSKNPPEKAPLENAWQKMGSEKLA